MAFEFLVSSDWHIGSLTGVFHDALKKQIREIHKIYEYALENGIGHIFVPGDMSDTTVLKTHELIELVRLFKYYDDSITTYYVAGNHDYHSSNRSSVDLLKHISDENMLKNLRIFNEPHYEKIEGININFVPYPHMERPLKKGNCINFVHMDTAGAKDDNGYEVKVKKEFEFGKGDITISGHIHKHQIIKSKRWIFCGNPYQKKFDELSTKGFLKCKATLTDKLKFDFEFVPTRPEFALKTVTLKSSKDVKDLKSDSNIAYKLIPEEGVILPSDISATHNVVSIKDKFIAPTASITTLNTNLKSGLKKYLRSCDLTDDQIKLALTDVDDAIELYSLSRS